MIDGSLRKIFRNKLRRGYDWQSIETGGTGRGIPDSNACEEKYGEFWVEFKQTDAWAVDIDSEQVGWLKRRILYGGRTFLAVRRWNDGGPRRGAAVDELWLCSGWYSGEVRASGLRAEGVVWLGVWSGGPSQWDWDAVKEALRSPPESLRPRGA
jgi:hypothetical protein